MGLLARLASSRLVRRADKLANEVANMTADSVLSRVTARATKMPEAEAKGYVRAHASLAVQRTIQRTWGRRSDMTIVLKDEVQSRATAQVVHMVGNQLRMARARQVTRKAG